MNRVGHAFFKRRMRETNAHLRRRSDRALLLPRQLLRRQRLHSGAADPRADVEEGPEPARAARAAARAQYFISGEINTKLAEHGRCAGQARSRSPRKYADGHQYQLDGLSVEYPDWHFNVRPSNTEPLLRLNLEATTPELMAAEARRGAGADSSVIDMPSRVVQRFGAIASAGLA